MGRVAGSRERVEDYLSGLEQIYGSFPVNQTTVSLPREQFERVGADHELRLVDAYVEVRDVNRQVLHVESGSTTELPGGAVDLDGPVEQQLKETVREDTGVECVVEDVESATITGVRDEDEPESETLYHLTVVFGASYESGTVAGEARWESERNEIQSTLA